jgi:hypothetical protein
VKFSTLLEIIGSGSILLVAGTVLFILGIGYGFSEATQLPLWVSLCGLGIVVSIIGFALVDHGSEKAEEKVKEMPSLDFVRNPWFIGGASVFGGFFLQRLWRGTRRVPAEKVVAVPIMTPAPGQAEAAVASINAPAAKKSAFSMSQFLGDELRTLGVLAGGAALNFAQKALGVPSAQQLFDDLLSSLEPKGSPPAPAERARPRPSDGMSEDELLARESARTVPSHNGSNSAGEFDSRFN